VSFDNHHNLCFFSAMTKTMAQRLKDLRHKLGWSQHQLAEEIGVSQSLVSRWERGGADPNMAERFELARLDTESPSKDWLGFDYPKNRPSYDDALVVGALKAGEWSPDFEWPKPERYNFEFPEIKAFSPPSKQAFLIRDRHFNRRFGAGSIVVTVGLTGQLLRGASLIDGDIVVLHRYRKVERLWESTCRLVRLVQGKPYLWFHSDDPEYQTPIAYEPDNPMENMAISGHVLAAYTPVDETLRHISKPNADDLRLRAAEAAETKEEESTGD
jgi:transcriptional regulator with XRE-family HTH domain